MKPRALSSSVILVLLLYGCDGNGAGPDPNQVASVTVSPPSSTVEIGSTVQLQATARNAAGGVVQTSFSWNSGGPSVATCSGTGLVTGLSEGTVTVSATTQGKTGSASIVVVDLTSPVPPSDVTSTPVSNTEISVTWNDNSGNEDEFRIDREQVPAAVAGTGNTSANAFTQVGIVGPNVTSFLDSGLTPSTAYRYRVRACNQNGCSDPSADQAEVSTFAELVIETTSVPDGLVGDAYEQTLVATGESGTTAWSVSDGSLPDGITLSGTGTLGGTPTTAGTFDFTVQAVGGGQTVTQELSLTVLALPTITTSSLPVGVVGVAYQIDLQASGGDGTYAWTVSAGSLPPGLTLDQGGNLAGTPTATGTFDFTLGITSIGKAASAAFSIHVYDPLVISTTSMAQGVVGSAYSQTVQATGGDGTYSWSVSIGALPDGLSLDSGSGVISGAPTVAQTFAFTIQVASAGLTATRDFSITVYAGLAVTTASLPDGTVGDAYSATLQAGGGSGAHTWSISQGTLPAGLSLASDGSITGTPTAGGTSDFTVRVESGDGQSAEAALSITVAWPPLSISATSLPDGLIGSAYSKALVATGGDATYTWSLTSGSLPSGLDLDSNTGTISGTPTSAETAAFTVQVTSAGLTATADLSITVYAILSVTTSSLPNGEEGISYTQSLAASGGDGDYTWSVTVGALADGLSLTPSSGLISGTPTTAGTSNFTVQVASGDGQTATAGLSLEIVLQTPISVTTTVVPDARSGVAYYELLAASGGTRTGYSWSLEAGVLPAGVTLSALGVLSGTPSESGSFSFTPRVEDDGGGSATAALELYSCEAVLSLSVGESLVKPFPDRCGMVLPDADADYRIALMPRAQVLESGGVPNLPGGLRLSAISGTPGVEFPLPPQMPVMQVRSSLPEDEALDPEILELAKATERLSWRLREEEYRSRPNMPMTVPSVLGPPLAPTEMGPALDPPASRQFMVWDEGQGVYVTINATLRAFSANVEYYEDSGEDGVGGDEGVVTDGTQATDQEITDLLAYYDTYGKPVIDDAFGGLGPDGTTNHFLGGLRPANDIDQNGGRIIVLQIRESRMLEGAAGYISNCDRYPLPENYNAGGHACPESNEAEMVYFSRPDSKYSLGTLVHEVKHISSFGYAILGGRGYNPAWLEEGTAEIAKDKSSRDAAGFTDGTRVGLYDIYPGGSSTQATAGMALVSARSRSFLKASPLSALIGYPDPNPDGSTYYGASWLFHRFLADAYGFGDEDGFFTSLNTGGSDVAQVEAVTGQTIEDLFAEFLVAIGVEGKPSARAATTRRFESYDFAGIADGWPSDGPWPYLQATSGFTTGIFSFATHYTSPNFFDFSSSGGTALRLDAFRSDGSDLNPGDDLVMVITKIR